MLFSFTCIAVECMCPPWFSNGTWSGKATWHGEEILNWEGCPELEPNLEGEALELAMLMAKPRTYQTEITYECPIGDNTYTVLL